MRKTHVRLLVPIVYALFLFSTRLAMSQTTIFNVPTTDTVAQGKVYVGFDWLAQNPNTRALDRLHIFNPRVVVGIAKNFEVGANVSVNHRTFTTDTFVEPNAKWRFAASETKGLAATAGAVLVAPLNNQVAGGKFALIYGNVSKQLKGSYGPRFTAGPYGVVSGGRAWSGPKAGAIVGYEQPIHAKVRIVADWYSGQNGLGYFTPGISFKLPGNSAASAGYSVGNDSYGNLRNNRSLFFRYGITF
jgi:hypothetical protein